MDLALEAGSYFLVLRFSHISSYAWETSMIVWPSLLQSR
jgi:hypothetical protein